MNDTLMEEIGLSYFARNLRLQLAFSLFLFSAVAANATQPSIIENCTQIVNDHAWYLDHSEDDLKKRSQDYTNLFTKDGILIQPDDDLQEQTHSGHNAIARAYLDSKTYRRELYITSNIRVKPTSDKTAIGTSYVTFYIHSSNGSMNDDGALRGVIEYRDKYQLTEQGCKFSKRHAILRLINLHGVIEPPVSE